MSDAEINFPPPGFEQEVLYRECKRNHATSLNCVIYDGCQEFLGTKDDVMLCAVCGCHQNFHFQYKKFKSQTRNTSNIGSSALVGQSEENSPKMITMLSKPKRKKRSVFTVNLKNQMTDFANRMEWTPKGTKKEEIEHFCSEIGVSQKTFLVWLNNHRPRAMKKNT